MAVTHEFYEGLFSAVFALYFAANIAASRDYNAFDTAAIMAGDHKALWRFLIGTLFLNVVPALYYDYMVHIIHASPLLGGVCVWSRMSIWDDLLMLFLGMAGGGFYRIFAGIMVCRLKNGRFAFYARQNCGVTWNNYGSRSDSCDGENINREGFYTRPSVAVRRFRINSWDHIWGSVFYLFVPCLVVVCLACQHGVWWR